MKIFSCYSLLRSQCYTRPFRKARGFCRGIKPAHRRAESMLRYFAQKRRDPCVGSAGLLRICRNALHFCKFIKIFL